MNVSRPHLILMHTRGIPFRNQFLFSRAGNPGGDTRALTVVEQCTGPPMSRVSGVGNPWCSLEITPPQINNVFSSATRHVKGYSQESTLM